MPTPSASPPGPFEVTLDALSGLPNPRWNLAGDAASELARRLAALPEASPTRVPEPPALGYRGFRIAGATGEPVHHVYRGVVRRNGELCPDPERRLERWLLDTAPDDLAPGLRRAVHRDLEAR